MYKLTLLGTDNKPIKPLVESKSPAEHFAGCVSLFLDMLRGAPEVIEQMTAMMGHVNFDSKQMPLYSVPIFVSWLHKHPYFDSAKIEVPTDPNFSCYQRITLLLQRNIFEPSLYKEFIDVLNQFSVPGIQKIEIMPNYKNRSVLNSLDFPAELIPEKICCSISAEIMDLPVVDKRNPAVVYDKQCIVEHMRRTHKNPHTNVTLEDGNLSEEVNMAKEINLFIEKVRVIYEFYKKAQLPLDYKKYSKELSDSAITADMLRQQLSPKDPPKDSDAMFKGIFASYPQKTQEIIKKCKLDPKDVKDVTLEKTLRTLAHNGLHAEMQFLLTTHKINVDSKDTGETEMTALHRAVIKASQDPKEKYFECIKELLSHGASNEEIDKSGKKPLEYAGNNDHIRSLFVTYSKSPI